MRKNRRKVVKRTKLLNKYRPRRLRKDESDVLELIFVTDDNPPIASRVKEEEVAT